MSRLACEIRIASERGYVAGRIEGLQAQLDGTKEAIDELASRISALSRPAGRPKRQRSRKAPKRS